MVVVTIRAALVLVALLNLAQHAQAKADRDSDCLIKVTKKRVFYCESIVIGYVALAAKQPTTAALVVYFESKFFAGLERVKTSHGSEFRKAGHPASNYPVEFTLAIEPMVLDKLWKSSAPLPSPAVRLPSEMRPRHVVVRWLDSSERVIAEKASDLEEVEEAWPELRPPVVWYRATIMGVNQSLASSVEVIVTGDSDALLGTTRGKL